MVTMDPVTRCSHIEICLLFSSFPYQRLPLVAEFALTDTLCSLRASLLGGICELWNTNKNELHIAIILVVLKSNRPTGKNIRESI